MMPWSRLIGILPGAFFILSLLFLISLSHIIQVYISKMQGKYFDIFSISYKS